MLTLSERSLPIVQPPAVIAPGVAAPAFAFAPPAGALTLEALWRRLWRQKWLFLFTLLSVLLATVVITWSMLPAYRAVSTIQIEKEGAQIVDFGNIKQLPPDMGEQDPFFRTQYEQLKSRQLADKVINKLNLEKRLFGRTENPNPFSNVLLMAKAWIKLAKDSLIALLPESFRSKDKEVAGKIVLTDEFLKNLYVEPIEKTHLVKVFYESPDPALSAEIVNTLVGSFINDSLSTESATDTYAQSFLDRELEKARTRLTNSENELVSYARDNQILEVNNSQGTQERKLEELNAALASAERRRIEAESQLGQARQHGNVAGVLNNPVVESLKRQLVDLEAQYQNQSKLFKPAYPEMQQLAQQIESVRAKLGKEVSDLKQSLEAEYAASARLEGKIRSELKGYKGELVNLRDRSVEYNALKREVETSRKLYDDLLQRKTEVNVASGATASNIRVIDPATQPADSFRPKKQVNLIIGLLTGLILATGLALLRETLRRSLASGDELQTASGLPVLGTIPHVRRAKEAELAMVTAHDPSSPVAEAYRIAATNLRFSIPGGIPRVLLLTSVNPAEGKSTSSVNLALSHAQMGAKVLLIDADLRRPTLHLKMDLHNHRGLGDYVEGRSDLAAITQRLADVKNVYVISAGQFRSDPMGVLASAKMKQLLELARQHFDMTIIDAPPVTGFADALMLSAQADATLLVTNEKNIDRKHLLNAIHQLQRVKQNVAGFLVVNAKNGITDARYYDRYAQTAGQGYNDYVDVKGGLNLGKARA